MRDEVRGKKRKGVGCCEEHGKIDHLACGITYNASHLSLALVVCGAGSVHRLTAGRVSERARRALGSDAVRLLLRVIVVGSTFFRVSFVDFCFPKKYSDESCRELIILLWSYHFVGFRVCSPNSHSSLCCCWRFC